VPGPGVPELILKVDSSNLRPLLDITGAPELLNFEWKVNPLLLEVVSRE